MTKEEAQQLMRDCDILLAEAEQLQREGSEDFGAVNWADLRAIDVIEERSLIHTDERYRFIRVEEAAPESTLARWLSERLDFPVHCEW